MRGQLLSKSVKRILSFMLCLVMCITLMPVTAKAANADAKEEVASTEIEAGNVWTKSSDGLTYTKPWSMSNPITKVKFHQLESGDYAVTIEAERLYEVWPEAGEYYENIDDPSFVVYWSIDGGTTKDWSAFYTQSEGTIYGTIGIEYRGDKSIPFAPDATYDFWLSYRNKPCSPSGEGLYIPADKSDTVLPNLTISGIEEPKVGSMPNSDVQATSTVSDAIIWAGVNWMSESDISEGFTSDSVYAEVLVVLAPGYTIDDTTVINFPEMDKTAKYSIGKNPEGDTYVSIKTKMMTPTEVTRTPLTSLDIFMYDLPVVGATVSDQAKASGHVEDETVGNLVEDVRFEWQTGSSTIFSAKPVYAKVFVTLKDGYTIDDATEIDFRDMDEAFGYNLTTEEGKVVVELRTKTFKPTTYSFSLANMQSAYLEDGAKYIAYLDTARDGFTKIVRNDLAMDDYFTFDSSSGEITVVGKLRIYGPYHSLNVTNGVVTFTGTEGSELVIESMGPSALEIEQNAELYLDGDLDFKLTSTAACVISGKTTGGWLTSTSEYTGDVTIEQKNSSSAIVRAYVDLNTTGNVKIINNAGTLPSPTVHNDKFWVRANSFYTNSSLESDEISIITTGDAIFDTPYATSISCGDCYIKADNIKFKTGSGYVINGWYKKSDNGEIILNATNDIIIDVKGYGGPIITAWNGIKMQCNNFNMSVENAGSTIGAKKVDIAANDTIKIKSNGDKVIGADEIYLSAKKLILESESGKTLEEVLDADRVVIDGEIAQLDGWQKVDGKWQFFENGKPKIGWIKDGKSWYYTDKDGNMVKGWKKIDSKWYYFDASGVMVSGWKKIDSKWYYFDGGAMVSGWKKIDSKWYYFDDGAMVSGWKKIDSKWYYFDGGVMVSGWKKIDSKWYYFDGGVMVSGWKKIDSKWYYFDGGAMVTGWKKLDNKWYYFGTNGVMVSNTTLTIDGKKYKFNASGVWVQ